MVRFATCPRLVSGALPMLLSALLLSACARNTEGPVLPGKAGPEYATQIPQPKLDGNLSDAFGKLGLDGLELPAIPEIPSESALADPALLERALKAYRELVTFADRLLPVLDQALEGLREMLGEIPPSSPGSPPSLSDMVEAARDQMQYLRDLAGEMAAMLDFLKRREGHFAPGGLALSFEFPDDARVYREFRRRLALISERVE
ncbi:MAG: hypothetical protein OEY97_06805, partial [Nitrospirota bacterium]|nr:hypothetical protein [Nitrospirota bacterium]